MLGKSERKPKRLADTKEIKPEAKKAEEVVKTAPAVVQKAHVAAPWRPPLLPLLNNVLFSVFKGLGKSSPVAGRVIVNAANPDAAATGEEVCPRTCFLPADRHTLQELADSRKLLAEGRFRRGGPLSGRHSRGVRKTSSFSPTRNSPIHRSLKAEAQRLIGQMPREGRELYELQYGARARRMLDEALGVGRRRARWPRFRGGSFTPAAAIRPRFCSGLHHFDHGRPLAGALTLAAVAGGGAVREEMEPALSLTMAACWLQAGVTEKARETLVSLRQRHPTLRVAVAGREVPHLHRRRGSGRLAGGPDRTAAAAAGPAKADHWLMFRGDAARNAASAGGTPLLNMRWRVAVTDDPLTDIRLGAVSAECIESRRSGHSGVSPLAVGDVLLMRTVRNLLAVDFATGKRLWEVPEEEAAEVCAGRARRGNLQTAAIDAGCGHLAADVERHDLWHPQQRRPLRVCDRGPGPGIRAGRGP